MSKWDGDLVANWDDTSKLKELFVGKSVKKVDNESLELSDGRRIKLVGNADCCAYYDLKHLGECENVITNVEVEAKPDDDDYDWSSDVPREPGRYRLFVYAGEQKINLAEFEGTDSNGYYGTGFWIEAKDGE